MKLIALLVAAPTVAAAQPTRYVEGGALFGAAQPVIGWNVMGSTAVGMQITGPLWLRGGVGFGGTINNLGTHGPNNGTNTIVRGGAEGRLCDSAREWLCGIAGVDVGVQHGTWAHERYDMPMANVDPTTALVAIPRIGFDAGTPTLHARFDLEADVALASSDAAMTAAPGRIAGIELGLGMVYAW